MLSNGPILIIDGDQKYVSIMRMILQEKGYSVDFAYSGPDGLRKVVPGKYSIIIMGYVLPLMKGGEVVEKIRRIDERVRIILMTGYKHSIPQSILARYNSVLEKPINTSQILNALRENFKALSIYVAQTRRLE